MGNVFPFQRKNVENHPRPKTTLGIAVADIVKSNAELSRNVLKLLAHLDTVDYLLDGTTDAETRARFKRRIVRAREKLTIASFQLSQQIGTLSSLQQQLAEAASPSLS
jgi:hypothetical protein